MVDDRSERSIEGRGIQAGDNNMQVNYFGVSQSVTAGRDVYVAGGNISFNEPAAGGGEPPLTDSVTGSPLNGQQVGKLRDALVAAFDEETLEVFLLEKLDKDLSHFAPSKGDFPYRVFKLIRRADQEGWVSVLISEAAHARPANNALRDLAGETRDSDSNAGLVRYGAPLTLYGVR